MNLKYELQSVISGIGKNSTGNLIEAAANHLGKSKGASGSTKKNEFTKDKETAQLIHWINQSDSWFNQVDENRFIARGAEPKQV
jgi:precorrin-6B methylase 1